MLTELRDLPSQAIAAELAMRPIVVTGNRRPSYLQPHRSACKARQPRAITDKSRRKIMRVTQTAGDFKVKAISGIHTVLLAIDWREPRRHGLSSVSASSAAARDNRKSGCARRKYSSPSNPIRNPTIPASRSGSYTSDHPIQSFLWVTTRRSPIRNTPSQSCRCMGSRGALEPRDEIKLTVRTEKEFDQGTGVWFNRGSIASQKFAEEFGNHPPQNINNPEDEEVVWLSRGLLEACLRYINETPAGDGLRVAAYEFTYPPVLYRASKRHLDKGVDVRIVYHDTKNEKGEDGDNERGIDQANLPSQKGRQQVLFPRTKTKIPHNKFIVRV